MQQLTLWIGFLGAALAARSGNLLSLSASTFLPARLRASARIVAFGVLAAVALCLAWASLPVCAGGKAERIVATAGSTAEMGGAGRHAHRIWRYRAAGGLVIESEVDRPRALRDRTAAPHRPLLRRHSRTHQPLQLWECWSWSWRPCWACPIFAVFGGFALLLFWRAGTPIASVPVEMYRLVASPLLPSIPLFTFAGYLMVEGGATRRFLRVFTALFSWAPGGMAIVTVLICAIFTWGGSGLTILSLGGLLVPVLIRSRYPERFSIGLLTASGSLGLLFPPSLPVILYGVYAATAIDRLFIGGLLPGLLMVTLAASMGIRQGLKSETVRDPFSAKEAFSAIWEAKWELLIPAIMLTGLFGGFGTLTEAAALTAVVALFIEVVIYRGISIRHDYMRVCVECATVVGGILLILGVALGFTNYLVDAEIPTRIVDWVLGHIHSKYLFLLLLNMCLLVVGSLMDIFAAILVIVPLLKPLTARLRNRSGADGHHLSFQSRTRLPHAPGRNQSVPGRLPFRKADVCGLPRAAAISAGVAVRRASDHLRSLDDLRPSALAGEVSTISFGGFAERRQRWNHWSGKCRDGCAHRVDRECGPDRAEARIPPECESGVQPVGGSQAAAARPRLGAMRTRNWKDVVESPDVDIVAELVGGTHVALDIVNAAISAGKSVVTANKELMALLRRRDLGPRHPRRHQSGDGSQRMRAAFPSTPCCAKAFRATGSPRCTES